LKRHGNPGAAICALALALAAAPQASAQGEPPPTLNGRTLGAAPMNLDALKGQVVMLFFWTTDCPVCLDKLPELRRNLAGWRGKPFQVIAVNQDNSLASAQAYAAVLDRVVPPDPQMNIVWRRDPAHRDSFGELPSRMPTTVVIDKTGRIAKTLRGRVPPELWDEVAELVLN
jgi:peroxiredoxin